MDVNFDEALIIRIKLNNDELQDLVSGEHLIFDFYSVLQIEIYHSPTLNYDTERKPYLNGDYESDSL